MSSTSFPAAARRGRGPRSRSRGRGRRQQDQGHLVSAQRLRVERDSSLMTAIEALPHDQLRQFAHRVAASHPSLAYEVWHMLSQGQSPQTTPAVAVPASPSPTWCLCGHCFPMASEMENVCCGYRPESCLSTWPEFALYINDKNVLEIQALYRRELILQFEEDYNKRMRFAAYRQFIIWTNSRLGAGVRVVIPSCCVIAIRKMFPSASGEYTGFNPGRLN